MRSFKTFLITLIWISSCNFGSELSITQGFVGLPQRLEPSFVHSPIERQILSQIFEPLLKIETGTKILKPVLAEKWQSNDKLTNFTIRLKPGVVFHNGQVLTAKIVKSSFKRYMKMAPDSPLTTVIDFIDIRDTLTIEFGLKYPFATFPYHLTNFSAPFIFIEPPDQENGANNIFGTGPFYLSDYNLDSIIELFRFPDYHGEAQKVDLLRFKFYDSIDEHLNDFQAGNVDIMHSIAGYLLDRLKWQGLIEYHEFPPIATTFLGFNNQKEPFNNALVRKAISHSIDVKKLVVHFNRGNAIVANGPVPPVLFEDYQYRKLQFDPELSKKLLTKAGIGKELNLKLYWTRAMTSRIAVLKGIQSYLSKININLELVAFDDWDTHDAAIKSDSAELFYDAFAAEILGEPDHFLYSMFHTKSSKNTLHYANPLVDSLLAVVRIQADPSKREKIYGQINEIIMNDTPAIFISHVKSNLAYNTRKIRSLKLSNFETIDFARIRLRN